MKEPADQLERQLLEEEKQKCWLCTPTIRREMRTWWRIAWPIGLSLLFRISMNVTDIAFLGHLGTDQLAGSSVAQLWMSVTSGGLWMAAGSATNTLVSQAIGAKNPTLAGIWLQASLATITVGVIPVSILWIFTPNVASMVGIQPHEQELARLYAYYSLIGLWPNIAFVVINNWLQCQGHVMPALIINAGAVGLNIGFNVLFIYGIPAAGWHGMGFIGSPVATAISRWIGFIAIVVYIKVRNLHHTGWGGWDLKRTFSKPILKEFLLKQMLPASLGVALEDWQLQVVGYMAATLGPADIDAHNAMLNLFFVLTSIMYGFTKSTIVRIGHHLGANRAELAKRVCWYTYLFCGCLATVGTIILITLRRDLGRIFSSDDEVLNLVSHVALLVGGGYVAMSFFFSSMSTLSGQGRPGVTAVSFLVGAWFIAVPLAFVFRDVVKMGLFGLWLAFTIGYGTVCISSVIAVLCSNWPKLAKRAVERSRLARAKGQEPLLQSGEKLLQQSDHMESGAGDFLVSDILSASESKEGPYPTNRSSIAPLAEEEATPTPIDIAVEDSLNH